MGRGVKGVACVILVVDLRGLRGREVAKAGLVALQVDVVQHLLGL